MAIRRIKAFFEFEAAGGIVLALAAVAAMIIANSPLMFGTKVLFTHQLPFKLVSLPLPKMLTTGSMMV